MHKNKLKKYYISLGIIIVVLVSIVANHEYAQAISVKPAGVGIQIGDATVTLGQATDNLIYAATGVSSVGSLMLLQNPIGTDKFRLDYAGNITTSGAITTRGNIDAGGNLCFSGDCKTSWADVLGGATGFIQDQNTVVQTANFRISGMGQATAFTTDYFVAGLGSEVVKITPPTGKEGLRIISSDFSPLVIRNTADSADLLRVSQAGDLTVSTINGRAIGTGSGGIAVNAGSASTNIGLSANYLEGRDWNDVTNLIANIPPSTPELHYFFSAQSNALHNGYSGLDSFCTYDASAVPGRSYHVWASGTTDRGFKKGVLYSNKQYGTFAITDTQSPDICRVLGITCDTNWINNYSNWIWDTSIDTCNNWNTNSTYAATARPSPVTTSLSAGTLNSTQYGGQYCGSNYAYLCIEDSGTYTDPGAVCGNSVVESGEACDDGNTVNDATCPYNCKADGGFCGDGYRGTGESCDPNEPSLSGRNRCSGSCSWLGDLDGDTIAGETDCWNNDGNAYPLSPNRSTISRDMNCDNQIESTTECTNTQTAYTVSTFPSCPSMAELQAAGECDKTQPGSSISTDGGGTPTCLYWGSPSYFSRCYWCAQQTTFYW